MLTPEEAGLLAGVTARAIYRHAEDGRVHFTETEDGALLVCSGSVEKKDFASEKDSKEEREVRTTRIRWRPGRRRQGKL